MKAFRWIVTLSLLWFLSAEAFAAPENMSAYAGRAGETFTFTLTGSGDESEWINGTDYYSLDSSLARAAVHAGVLAEGETDEVQVTVLSETVYFYSSMRNGVYSGSSNRENEAYTFIDPDDVVSIHWQSIAYDEDNFPVDETTYGIPGQAVESPHFYGGGISWELDGVRQANPDGSSIQDLSLEYASVDQEAIGYYVYFYAADDDNDGLADYAEILYYGNFDHGPKEDTDNDTVPFYLELEDGFSPLMANSHSGGGLVSLCSSSRFWRSGNLNRLTVQSDPAGMEDEGLYLAPAEEYRAWGYVFDHFYNEEYQFVGWWLNGVRQADGHGVSLDDFNFSIEADAVLEARFVSYQEDSDGDGLADYLELLYGDDLTMRDGDSDTDGDGLGLSVDHGNSVFQPYLKNQNTGGGLVSVVGSGRHYTSSNLVAWTARSEPEGMVDETGMNLVGDVLEFSPQIPPIIDGEPYHLAYWTVNGEKQMNASGGMSEEFSVETIPDMEVVFVYLPSIEDSDGDRLWDWREFHVFSTLEHAAKEDVDGDGLNLYAEWAENFDHGLKDGNSGGGLVSTCSSWTRLSDVLATASPVSFVVNGLSQAFNGQGLPVSVETIPSGVDTVVLYGGSIDAPVHAGSYTVEVLTDEEGYAGRSYYTMTVNPGSGSISLENLDRLMDGRAKSVACLTQPADLPVEILYDGSYDVPSEPGEYTVQATILHPDYQGSEEATLVIRKWQPAQVNVWKGANLLAWPTQRGYTYLVQTSHDLVNWETQLVIPVDHANGLSVPLDDFLIEDRDFVRVVIYTP